MPFLHKRVGPTSFGFGTSEPAASEPQDEQVKPEPHREVGRYNQDRPVAMGSPT